MTAMQIPTQLPTATPTYEQRLQTLSEASVHQHFDAGLFRDQAGHESAAADVTLPRSTP